MRRAAALLSALFVFAGCPETESVAPSRPTGLTAEPGTKQVTLDCNPVTRATSYNVYWKTSPGVTMADAKISGVTLPYVHESLTNGTTYYYVVTAVGEDGESLPSSEASATPAAVLPVINGLVTTYVGGATTLLVTVCTTSSCSVPVGDATVTMNDTTLAWDSAQVSYAADATPTGDVTLTVTIPAGSLAVEGSYTATATWYTTVPGVTAPANLDTWAVDAAHDITWSAGSPTATTPASVYFVGIWDGTRTFFVGPSTEVPFEVATDSTTFNVVANKLTKADYYLFVGIGTPGLFSKTGGVPVTGAAEGSYLGIGRFSDTKAVKVTVQ